MTTEGNGKKKIPKLMIVVPCYNEEAVLPISSRLFLTELEDLIAKRKVADESQILLVNDGSHDETWGIIRELADNDEHFLGLSLSRNYGHQNALLAGLMEAKDKADITISIDCDGQDDVKAMEAMVDAYAKGSDIVYGVRSRRDADSTFKKKTAEGFYRFLQWLGADVVYNHADFRLMSRRALDELANFKEANLFLRGMVPLIGLHSTSVYYERKERLAGKSHYSFSRMCSFAADGVTSFSVKPLRIITWLGFLVALVSFIGVIWAFITAISGNVVPGWASMTCIICFVSGVQLICLGVMGEYIGKIYLEVKERPRYIISERTWIDAPGSVWKR